jgi:hypothetical protein
VTGGITHLYAGVPVSDLDARIDWCTRFFGRPPDHRVGEEIDWEIDERAWLFIEPNAARAAAGRITLSVAGLDALLERLAAERIEHEPDVLTGGPNRKEVSAELSAASESYIRRDQALRATQ